MIERAAVVGLGVRVGAVPNRGVGPRVRGERTQTITSSWMKRVTAVVKVGGVVGAKAAGGVKVVLEMKTCWFKVQVRCSLIHT
jgi:hypothetical protein